MDSSKCRCVECLTKEMKNFGVIDYDGPITRQMKARQDACHDASQAHKAHHAELEYKKKLTLLARANLFTKKDLVDGVDPDDINIVIAQTNTTQENAIAALKNNKGDLLSAILEITELPRLECATPPKRRHPKTVYTVLDSDLRGKSAGVVVNAFEDDVIAGSVGIKCPTPPKTRPMTPPKRTLDLARDISDGVCPTRPTRPTPPRTRPMTLTNMRDRTEVPMNVEVPEQSEKPEKPRNDSQYTATQLWRLLDYDRQFRNVKATGDLIPMSTFSWKGSAEDDRAYTFPTLTMNTSRGLVSTPCFDNDKFKERLYENYAPELEGMDWDNVLLAGGLISTIIHHDAVTEHCTTNSDWRYRSLPNGMYRTNDYGKPDVDLFIYGLTIDKADEKVKQIVNHLLAKGKKLPTKSKGTVRRNRNVLTLEFSNGDLTRRPRKYQIIFRLYHTNSEIPHGFDLGSSQGAFDGSTVEFTSLGKFAQEHGCNILDPMRRSKSYEHRSYKYLRRGYDLVMPYLDNMKLIDGVKVIKQIDFPYFTAVLLPSSSAPLLNRFVVTSILMNQCGPARSFYDDGSPIDLDQQSMFRWNLRCLQEGNLDRLGYILDAKLLDSEDFTADYVLKFPIKQLEERLTKFYNTVVPDAIWNGKQFDTDALHKYIPLLSCASVASSLFSLNSDGKIEYMKSLTASRASGLLSKLSSSEHMLGRYEWMVDNPASQFSPIESTAVDYYGKYMVTE